jgi:hypothetical protein
MIPHHTMAQAAAVYRDGACLAREPGVRDMLDALRGLILAAALRLPVRLDVSDHEPYGSMEHMRDCVRATGRMVVWAGASEGLPQWDARTNWAFRAVHDFDHMQRGCDFTFGGEREAWAAIADRWPILGPVTYSEVVLQAAYVNVYGAFPAQKVVIL